MFVEIHILQNFALSNLNRDDTGAPKDCEFGGYRRARISSQCIKRAIRAYFADNALLSGENLSVRTKRLVAELGRRLVSQDHPLADALQVARAALDCISLKVKEENKTEYLLFVGRGEVAAIASVCEQYWAPLLAIGKSEVTAPTEARGRKGKNQAVPGAPKDLVEALAGCLSGGDAADLALFGRMIANKPDKSVDAATQVAHAISTNRVVTEFDFFTAVDDLQPADADEGHGAAMMGTVQYHSSCYYRYANLDLRQLNVNLSGNSNLAQSAVRAFLEATILTVPTGKQTGTAPQNPPSFAMIVIRERGLWSLANAFVNPVRPTAEGDLVQNSIRELVSYWGKLENAYGDGAVLYRGAISLENIDLNTITREPDIRALLDRVLEHVRVAS